MCRWTCWAAMASRANAFSPVNSTSRCWRLLRKCADTLASISLRPKRRVVPRRWQSCRHCCRSRWSVRRCGVMTTHSGPTRCRCGAGNGFPRARRATRAGFSAHKSIPPRPAPRAADPAFQIGEGARAQRALRARSWPSRGRTCARHVASSALRRAAETGRN